MQYHIQHKAYAVFMGRLLWNVSKLHKIVGNVNIACNVILYVTKVLKKQQQSHIYMELYKIQQYNDRR